MLVVDDILFSPVKSVLWIFRELHKRAVEEQEGEGQRITQQLSELYMQLETGQITEDEFDETESELLDRLDAFNERHDAQLEEEDGK